MNKGQGALMKIGIVGSGISGLMAAHDLFQEGHDVTIYEASSHVGGHVRTIWIDGAPNELGVFMFDPKSMHPKMASFARQLGCEMREFPLTYTLEYPEDGISWTNGNLDLPKTFRDLQVLLSMTKDSLGKGHFLRNHKFLFDLAKLQDDLKGFLDDPSFHDMTLDEAIKSGKTSKDVYDFWIVPNLICWWGVSREEAGTCSARVVFDSFYQVKENAQFFFVNGWSQFIDAIAKPFKNRILTSKPVEKVIRKGQKVTIVSQGEAKEFDHVVIATPPSVAKSLLQDQSEEETLILNSFPTKTTDVFLHTDKSFSPKKKTQGVINSLKDKRGEFTTFWTGGLHPTKPNIFVSWGDHLKESPNEKEVLLTCKWLRTIPEKKYLKACQKINEIQGNGGVWYAGAHVHALDPKDAPSVWHENAFLSGKQVAQKINNLKKLD